MFKRMTVFLVCIIMVFTIGLCVSNAATQPVIKGSFIQIWPLASGNTSGTVTPWTYNDWLDELGYMQAAGMDTLIVGTVADYEKKTVWYPNPNIQGYNYTVDPTCTYDMPLYILNAAAQNNIQVYFGMNATSQWFNYGVSDGGTWLSQKMSADIAVAADFYAKYGNHPAFGGWYIVEECDNIVATTTAKQDIIGTQFDRFCDFVHGLTPTKKVINCPWANASLYPNGGGLSPAGWEDMWKRILGLANIDILAMQDSVGAGGCNRTQATQYIQAQYNACVYRGRISWVDVETFRQEDWSSMTVGEIVDSMNHYTQYADKYLTFAYNHYQSPRQKNPAYYQAYMNYLNNNMTLDTTAPTQPTNFAVSQVSPYDISLSWTASTDNVALLGYKVFRDGNYFMTVFQPSASFRDCNLAPGVTHSYYIQAIDGVGNVSAATQTVTATTQGQYQTNFALNRPYTLSVNSHSAYPDSTGAELTDGQKGSISYTDGAWQGWPDTGNFEIVIDLGKARNINGISVDFLRMLSVAANVPEKVEFYTSDSPNSGFTLVGQMSQFDLPIYTMPANMTCVYAAGNLNENKRYVKIKVTGGDRWVFVDEIEVRGTEINYALNKPYTASMPANQSYPDTNGNELTNGVYAAPSNYADSGWQGRWSQNDFTYDIVVDLGDTYAVQNFITTYLNSPVLGIYNPLSVSYSVSTDNINFTSIGTVTGSTVTSEASVPYGLELTNAVNARYIKITVSSRNVWVFMDEIKVTN